MRGKRQASREQGPASALVVPQWLTPQWPAPPGVRALSTLRGGGGVSRPPYASLNLGDHVGDAPMAVTRNRRSLLEAAGLPAQPSWLAQVHGTAVAHLDAGVGAAVADAAPADTTPADAAVTGRRGVVCAILTADCLPVLFSTLAGDRVGAAHAGWRGLAAGVLEATVRALGAPPAEIMAWLGPAIGPGHFEVGAEVRAIFVDDDAAAAPAFVPQAGGYLADLYALARLRLTRVGVTRIHGGGECTYASADRYFSHRRDGVTGRQASLIWREQEAHG